MSAHRRVCTSVAPSIAPAPDFNPPSASMNPAASDGHTHRCVHDAEPVPGSAPLVHECGCGMTWTGIGAAQASAVADLAAPGMPVSRLELANHLNRYINAKVEQAEASGRRVEWSVIAGMRLSGDWLAGLIGHKDDRALSDITDGRGR